MAIERTRPLGNMTGTITLSTYTSSKWYGTLTGNVTLNLQGMDEGKVISLYVTQDATAGRTLTIPAAGGGANQVVGPATAISAVAAKTSKVVIAKIGNIYRVEIYAQA